MILNRFEFFLMNNPVRALIQKTIEVRRLRKLSSLGKGKHILEIGCGRGVGTKLIQKNFQARLIHAIDLDPRMIARAKKRVKDPAISFQVASAAHIPFEKNTFDAVIDFGIIHHIPDWKNCLVEVHRVLKPGGEFLLEDLSIESFQTPLGRIYKTLLEHPYKEMYTEKAFVEELKRLGFEIRFHKTYKTFSLLRYFVVVAVKKV